MSRWVRWEYVIPRILGAAVALLVVQFCLGIVVRMLVVEAGQTAVGAKVELARARVALTGGHLELHDLRVANPRAPMENLFQLDHAVLDLRNSAMLHKRIVVESGRIHGLQFATPRVASGALPASGGAAGAVSLRWIGEESAELAEAWLKQLADRFEKDVLEELHMVRLANELAARWPERHKELESRVKNLSDRGRTLKSTYADARVNPLRHVDFLRKLPSDVVALQNEFVRLTADIERLPGLIEADRQAILAAREHDEELLRRHFQIDVIDSSLLTAYFLHEHLQGPAGELLAWTLWLQNFIGDDPELDSVARMRGVDVLFPSVERAPALLVNALELEGRVTMGGESVPIAGLLQNLSTEPKLQDAPTRLTLSAGGTKPWQLAATIDRTSDRARDEIHFDCQSLPIAGRAWGASDKLRFTVAPSAAAMNLHLVVDEGRLSGTVQIVQKDLALEPTLGDELNHVPVAAALRESLAGISTVTLRLDLGGTLEKPECKLSSNLGPAVADAMSRALREAAETQSRVLLAHATERVDQRMTALERQLAARRRELLEPLDGSVALVESVLREHKSASQLSVERIGRQLPAGSLFR